MATIGVSSSISAMVAFLLLTNSPDTVKGLECYSFTGEMVQNGSHAHELPPYADVIECRPEDTMCIKSYTYYREDILGDESWSTMFLWDCGNFGLAHQSLGHKCGDPLELGTAQRSGQDAAIFVYTRACTCCGDLCNGQQMDQVCNGEPTFASKCYAASSSTPFGVNDFKAEVIPCTETQSCFKMGIVVNRNTTGYTWGCVNTPEGKCGKSAYERDGDNSEKICTCCGDLCNGEPMNPIVADNPDCTATLPTTTPASDNDTLIAIVASVLGVLIALALAALAVAIFLISHLRSELATSAPVRLEMLRGDGSSRLPTLTSPKSLCYSERLPSE